MREVIHTMEAPAAVGPYSQGIATDNIVFVSGQLPIHPTTNAMLDAAAEQARQSLENLKAVLEAAGSGLDAVLKTTIFLTDMDDFQAVNEVYASYFPENPPARSCVEVAALPKGAKIEIEAIAWRS